MAALESDDAASLPTAPAEPFVAGIRFESKSLAEKSETGNVAIAREDARSLTYSDFRDRYMAPNRPVVVHNVTHDWRAHREWVSLDGGPDLDYLRENFGRCRVCVAHCGDREFTDQRREEMVLAEYLGRWARRGRDSLYVKDWHFVRDVPGYGAYETPPFFADDWMNEYWTACLDDDYRFVYIGPQGSWTPLHSDVYGSFSWSANITGRKRWVLFPPECTPAFRSKLNSNTVYDIDALPRPCGPEYPDFEGAMERAIEVIQRPGEAIFVPSGWCHQVYNEEDTLSINHNWLNACNLGRVWQHLKDELRKVEDALADCKDGFDSAAEWSSHCQLVMNANAGINYERFHEFLLFIAKRRLSALAPTPRGPRLGSRCDGLGTAGDAGCLFDLERILECIDDMPADVPGLAEARSEFWPNCRMRLGITTTPP